MDGAKEMVEDGAVEDEAVVEVGDGAVEDEAVVEVGDGAVEDEAVVEVGDAAVEETLAGGNIGGAVRVGHTVRRPTGPWTPAVHALLGHLASRELSSIPAVLGHDDSGREMLTYLPGRVIDVNNESLTPGQLVSLVNWTRALHEAVNNFRHPGPWRFFPVPTSLIAKHTAITKHASVADCTAVTKHASVADYTAVTKHASVADYTAVTKHASVADYTAVTKHAAAADHAAAEPTAVTKRNVTAVTKRNAAEATSVIGSSEFIGHNDIAPYNACFDGDDLVGVFDWDLAGPSTPLLELAFIAWNCVPLWRDDGARVAAERLQLIATTYGGFEAQQILDAVPDRIQIMLDGIPVAAAAGDQGMANLMTLGEPERSARSLASLIERFPDIKVHLP